MKRRALLTLSVATTLGWSQAQAQEAAVLEEIVVTARQRAEKIEDVPATIQAFTARDIEIAGIERPTDFIALTPGLAQVQTAEVGDLQLSIRGINTGRDAETNFALVIDGVLQTNPTAFNQELANVQQIEVLKGPQGAIYGRNAVSGAIIVTTTKPSQGFGGSVDVGFGNNNTRKARVYLDGGSEAAQFGVSGYYRETDGFFENSFRGCDDCVDFFKEYGVTPRLIVPMGENGELDFKAKYSKLEGGAINFNATFALPFFAQFVGNPDFFEDVNEHEFNYISSIIPTNEQENKQFSVKGEWNLDVGTLTAWAAYNDQTNFFLTDGTSAAFGLYARTAECQSDITNQVGGPLPSPTFYAGANSVLPPYSPSRCDGYQYQQRDQEDTSLEIRIASPADQPFRWLAGAYYADIDRRVVVAQGGDRGTGLLEEAFVPSTGPNPTDLLYDDDLNSKVTAVFGQIAYDVMPGAELALALRYDSEKREVNNNVPTGANAFAQTPLFGPGPGVPFINPAYTVNPALATSGIPDRDKTFSQLQPKVSFNWKFTDDWTAFASYGYGFRSGGFNSTGSNATIQTFLGALRFVDAAGNVTTTPSLVTDGINYDQYEKEVAKAAEIGLKAELLDRTLALNLAVYHTDVEDMQIFNFLAGPFGLLRVVTNIDEATLQGVEADLRWRASQYVNLFAGVGLLDSEIDTYRGRPYTKGNKVPYAPDYTANAGVDFIVPMGDSGLSLTARLDASFTGETWFSAVQEESVVTLFGVPGDYSKTSRDSFTTVNARLGISADNWQVTAWVRNLTDEEYLAEVIPAPEFGGTFSHEAPGRAIGLDLKYSFGR